MRLLSPSTRPRVPLIDAALPRSLLEAATTHKGSVRRVGCGAEPGGEIAHRGWDLGGGGKRVATGLGQDEEALIGVTAGSERFRTLPKSSSPSP
jgi:hypothetical protein